MIVVVQRVSRAKCIVSDNITGQIDKGLMVLVGFTNGDSIEEIKKMAYKIVNLRIFDDEAGKMNLSVLDVKGSILSISQFTLYANTTRGHRPSFTDALNSSEATILYDLFNKELEKHNIVVEKGIFGSHMYIDFINDGPVSIIMDSKNF